MFPDADRRQEMRTTCLNVTYRYMKPRRQIDLKFFGLFGVPDGI